MSWIALAVIVVGIAIVAVVVSVATSFSREVSGVLDEDGKYRKDPNRMFPSYVVFEAKRRADHRCEFVTFFGRRCPNSTKNTVLHADHWIPWSKGGSSSEANLVILCQQCNLQKSSEVPFKWETKRLYNSRLKYQINPIRPGHHYASSPLEDFFADGRPRVDVYPEYDDPIGTVVYDDDQAHEIEPEDFYRRYADDER